MKKTIYLIAIGVITLLCITIGIFRSSKNGRYNWKKNIKITWNNEENIEEFENEKEYSKALESFSEIEIDAQVLTVEIERGTNYWAYAAYSKEFLEPKLKLQNGKLSIKQSTKNGPNMGTTTAILRLSIPYDVDLDNIYINVNVGEIEIEDISSDKIRIKNNVGQIDVTDCKFSKLDADTNVGEIDIRIEDDLKDYSIKAETNIGEIEIGGKNYKKSFTQKGNDNKKIELKTNVGEISLN